jgi:hypothetical protein
MVFLAQKRFAGCLGSEHAGLAFDAKIAVEAAMLRNQVSVPTHSDQLFRLIPISRSD